MIPTYLTVPDVAEILRMSEEYVQRQCRTGHLRAKKLGTSWRITEAEVVAFMEDDREAPAAREMRTPSGRLLTARQRRRASLYNGLPD